MNRRPKPRPDSQGSLPPIANKRTFMSHGGEALGALPNPYNPVGLPNAHHPNHPGGLTFSTPGTEAWRNQPKTATENFLLGEKQNEVVPTSLHHSSNSAWNSSSPVDVLDDVVFVAADALPSDASASRILRSRTSANNSLAPVRPPSGNLALQCTSTTTNVTTTKTTNGAGAISSGCREGRTDSGRNGRPEHRNAWGSSSSSATNSRSARHQRTYAKIPNEREAPVGAEPPSPTSHKNSMRKVLGTGDVAESTYLPELPGRRPCQGPDSQLGQGHEMPTRRPKEADEGPESGIADLEFQHPADCTEEASDDSNESDREKRIIDWLIQVENSKAPAAAPSAAAAAQERRRASRLRRADSRRQSSGHVEDDGLALLPDQSVTNSIRIVYDGD